MPVRDLNDQGRFVVKPDFVDDLGKFPAEFFRQENDPDLFICNGALQSFLKLSALMDNGTLHACQTHACVGIDIVADQIHFHRNPPLKADQGS